MAIFNRVTKAAVSPPPPQGKALAAASGISGGYSAQNVGVNMVGQYYSYFEGPARNAAISVPTISRARDLIASVVSSTPLQMYKEVWDETAGEMERVYIQPRTWLKQPDPASTYDFLMAWTLDDLFFFGRAFWLIQERDAAGWPISFTRLPAAMITTRDQAGPVFFAPSNQVFFQGSQIDEKNLVQFLSPIQGIIYQGERCISTALRIEQSRHRNAQSSLPSGVLSQTGGEPLSAQELADLAASFNAARENNQTAALNEFLSYTETKALPDNMLMIDSANFSAMECARLTNIPPYLAGLSVGSYAYSNSQSAREDLYIFSARQYMNCIENTLSMNYIIPRGNYICFDVDDYLNSAISAPDADNMPAETMQDAADTALNESTQESLA